MPFQSVYNHHDVRMAEEVVERIKGAGYISELDVRDIGYDDQINLTVELNILSDRNCHDSMLPLIRKEA